MMATTTPKITTALSTNIETEISQPKRSTNNNNTTHDDHNNNDNVTTTAEDLHNTIVAAWQTEPFNIEVACATTTSILCTQIDQLIKDGVMAYHHAEQCHDENVYYGQEMIRKDDEIHNLRVTENKHTAAVTNMMRTLDQSRTSVQINAQKAVSEAHLRAELANAISHRDEAIARDNQSQRQSILAQDEIQDLKRKLSKITQEKLKLERDSRTALTLARNIDYQKNHNAGDMEYYQRKVMELTGQVTTYNSILAEKNRQLDEMKRQIERNMSQNRLEQLRRGHNSNANM